MLNLGMTSQLIPPKERGLTSERAEELLKIYGKNELVPSRAQAQFQQILKILSDPMGLMMLGLAALYFITGDRSDAIMILIAYIPVTAVDVFLDLKSERALKALQANLQSSAKVIRDGSLKEVALQNLVPGDIIAFEEGQSLPADGKVIECHNLLINESALTGESLPIEKENDFDFFAGTTILSGRGFGLIEKTGRKTQFGKISGLLEATQGQESPLQIKVHTLVKKILAIAGVLVIGLFCIEYFRGTDLISSLIAALTFGMAAIPEEFPLVFTLYLSMGAYRLSKHGVLVKSLPSVEALGNVDVICTDKTGTLTEGRFTLSETVPFGDLSPTARNMIAVLACEPTPVDAMEMALLESLKDINNVHQQWTLRHDYPFEPKGKHMAHIWSNNLGDELLAMKGAVEGVLELSDVTETERRTILASVDRYASQGKRILGLAHKKGPFSGNRIQDEAKVHFAGLLIFSDPIRRSAKDAIQKCQDSGIEIKMLTGDHRLTAHAIADELQITHLESSIYSGSELEAMNDLNRRQAYLQGSIFARVSPQQKYEMIQTLRQNDKIVAMTGDGVNDSPALKLADIGVSMGENATDVARSTAKLVLMKNDFNGLVQAILEGRNVFANLQRSFSYLIAFHIPVVLLALLAPILGNQPLLLPVHIILLELIVHPISAFAFENLKSTQPQRRKTLLTRMTAVTAIFSGILLSFLSLAPMLLSDFSSQFNHFRSLALSTLLFGNIGFTVVDAWPHFKNSKVAAITGVLFCLPFILCNFEIFREFFHLDPLSFRELGQSLTLGLVASLPTFIIRRKTGS